MGFCPLWHSTLSVALTKTINKTAKKMNELQQKYRIERIHSDDQIEHFYAHVCLMGHTFYKHADFQSWHTCKICLLLFANDQTSNNQYLSSFSYVCNHQFRVWLVIRPNIKCTLRNRLALFVPLVVLHWSHFGTALAPSHVCQVNSLVLWNNDTTSDAAS